MSEEGAPPRARALLSRFGIAPRKALGQNFLIDDNIIERIVKLARLDGETSVVEIGPGLGAITFGLAAVAKRVTAVDADRTLVPILQTVLAESGVGNVEVVNADALAFDFSAAAVQAGSPLVVVGNLPYQITSPLLFAVLGAADSGRVVSRALFMVQKEVADRMCATPGGKIYGRLSVMVQQFATVRVVLKVGSRAFLPPPAVLSSVIEIVPRSVPLGPIDSVLRFEYVVKAAFATRRKMLRNALETGYEREIVTQALAESAIDGERRAETLTVVEFARLSNALPDPVPGA
jgi:16S rRNA (adenine1518-N6/adenine1519-N6)-dimethyltransferase